MPTIKDKANLLRAAKAERAVVPYWLDDPDKDANVTDLLIDTMHYCAVHRIGFNAQLRKARLHFIAETK